MQFSSGIWRVTVASFGFLSGQNSQFLFCKRNVYGGLAAVLLCWLGVSAAQAQSLETEAVWSENGHLYRVYGANEMTWDDARQFAEGIRRPIGFKQGRLVCIGDENENQFVASLLPGTFNEAWLGGFQYPDEQSPEEGWNWLNGDPWGYTNWSPGEPNDGYGPGSEQVLGMWGPANDEVAGTWNDEDLLSNVSGFVVEFDPTSLGDVDGDGCVNDVDLLIVLFNFGGEGDGDLNQDGIIDDVDLLEVLFNFGNGC